jgi:hypothetical protein
LSAEIKNKIEMDYSWLERVNLLWKVLEQLYGSSNNKKSLSSAPENISSSSILFDQSQEGQSCSQKEKAKSASLGKPGCPVLEEQKMSYLKKMIALHQVLTSMMMMTHMMSVMNKNSWWSLRNS